MSTLISAESSLFWDTDREECLFSASATELLDATLRTFGRRMEWILPGRVGDTRGDTLLAVHRRPTIRQALVETGYLDITRRSGPRATSRR